MSLTKQNNCMLKKLAEMYGFNAEEAIERLTSSSKKEKLKKSEVCQDCKKDFKLCFCNNLEYYNEKIESIIKIQSQWRNYIKTPNIIMDLEEIIKNNVYIKNCKSNKKKDLDSLSYLITRELSQSDCIKLGTGLEKIFYDIVLHHTNLKDIKPKNKKGIKEKDHLFCDEINKIIYYAEFKSNLNLDTEKSKSTYEKCLTIVNELKENYPDYKIKWGLVGCRYINNISIPNKIKHKYIDIKNNLFGVNEYLNLLDTKLNFTINEYSKFVNNIADRMFE